ncbi:hypothetical protein H5410_041666 [Solanum commersonii]|uniref:Uncharacterized protein n=1 Tax=Solanum commersonii TaxID=4109 RepID=A0A9J5XVD5_SOLCO|nr:hypothetical protein H5410_041666 [Solanum commersonii]
MEISSLSGNLPRFKWNLMSTHSLGHRSSGLGFATSLSGKPKTHGWFCICNYKPIKLNHNH